MYSFMELPAVVNPVIRKMRAWYWVYRGDTAIHPIDEELYRYAKIVDLNLKLNAPTRQSVYSNFVFWKGLHYQ